MIGVSQLLVDHDHTPLYNRFSISMDVPWIDARQKKIINLVHCVDSPLSILLPAHAPATFTLQQIQLRSQLGLSDCSKV